MQYMVKNRCLYKIKGYGKRKFITLKTGGI